MAKYETMLVTSVKLDEEASAALVGKFKSLIEANGTIDGVDEWGKRRLAYPINKEEEGLYTLIHFTSEPTFPTELERVYRITDGVLRSLIVAKEEGAEMPEKAEPAVETPAVEPKAEEAAEEEPKAEETEEAAPAEEPKAEEEA